MTMTKIPKPEGRHRVGAPHSVPWAELETNLADRTERELAWFEAAGAVSLTGGHTRCSLWHGVTRCGSPGVYEVEGYPGRVFCAPDAVSRAAVRVRMVRAQQRHNDVTQPLPRIEDE